MDASGTVQGHYEYSPFGKITQQSSSEASEFDYRFSSEVFDTETGLVYYNYRYYSPELGRWLSRDPVGERGRNNLYEMVGNNAVNWWGYLGLDTTLNISAAIGLGTPYLPYTTAVTNLSNPLDTQFKKLNCILKGLIQFVKDTGTENINQLLGVASDNFLHSWTDYTQPAAQYYLGNYSSASDCSISDTLLDAMDYTPFVDAADGFNYGFGIAINQSTLFSDNPLTAINTLIHEPQHNFSQHGIGHEVVTGHSMEYTNENNPLTGIAVSTTTENWANMIQQGLEEAAIAARLTPTKGCCTISPNKDKEITNMLQSIYCKCGQEF